VYPVLYLLDANGLFGMTTEMLRVLNFFGGMRDVIVVGIGLWLILGRVRVIRRERAEARMHGVDRHRPESESIAPGDHIIRAVARRYDPDDVRSHYDRHVLRRSLSRSAQSGEVDDHEKADAAATVE